jgi:hypothetical protein
VEEKMRALLRVWAVVVGVGALGTCARAQLIRPDTAMASSFFGSTYRAENAINGSGLPANFTVADAHAAYSNSGEGKHWTTASGTPANASITFGFATPRYLVAFHLWNHQSTVPPATNPGYDVTLFDLTFLGADGTTVLRTLNDLAAAPDTATGQTFTFPLVEDVSFVRFDVEAVQGATAFTGVAEVAFAVPEPGCAALAAAVAMGLGVRRRRP